MNFPLITLLIIGFSFFGFSQTKEEDYTTYNTDKASISINTLDEEKIDLYLELATELITKDPIKADSILKLGQNILDVNPKSYVVQRGIYMKTKGYILIELGDNDTGFNLINKASDYFKSLNDTVNYGVWVIDTSDYYSQHLDNDIKVYNYASRSIELFKKNNDTVGVVGGYIMLGATNMNIGDYKHAIEQFTRAIELLSGLNGYDLPFVCYANRGLAYAKLGEYKNAIKDHKKALEIRTIECIDECLILKAKIVYYNLMLNALKPNNENIKLVIKYLDDVKSDYFRSQLFVILGDYYSELKDWNKADEYYKQSLKLIKDKNYELEILKKRAFTSKQLSNYALATKLYYTIVAKEDSLKYLNFQNQIAYWQAEYREEEKQEKIKNLQHQNELKNAVIVYKDKISFMLVLGVIALGLFILILYKQKKNIDGKNRTLLQNQSYLEKHWKEAQSHNKSLKHEINELKETFKKEYEINEKYDNSGLSAEQTKTLLSILMYLVTEEKVYLNKEVTLSTLAKKIGVNRSYLSQIINTEFGKNFNQFINEYRIHEACENLRNPINLKYNIDYISQISGFKSISSFNTAFKKQVGVTPSYYRKEYLKK